MGYITVKRYGALARGGRRVADRVGHTMSRDAPPQVLPLVAIRGPDRPSVEERNRALRRARVLNRVTIGWNAVEGLVAVAAGVLAGSVSLVGFGIDSGIEVSAAVILAWRLRRERDGGCMQDADRRATRAIALSLAALAAYVTVEAVRDLAAGATPDVSYAGMAIAGLSLVVMPLLAAAKRRLAPILGSRAVEADAAQTHICAWLSGVLLVGLTANAILGWWWADPAAALGIAALASWEAVRTWRADSLADTCCA